MPPTIWRFAAALSLLALAHDAGAARRPRYGGTLRVEMSAAISVLDPAATGEATARLAPLVFDRLVRIDRHGRPRPALAVSWSHDAEYRRWQFRLRPGVRFHDGSPLAAGAAVAAVLESALPPGFKVQPGGDILAIDCPRPTPGLAMDLGRRGYIFARDGGGAAIGTGPFRLARLEPGQRAVFTANADHWAGRPFLDSVEIAMGRTAREQWIDLEVGKADVVELAPAEARRAAERGRPVWSSAPMVLLAVAFEEGRPADKRLREALALSIDRIAIHNVLLQRRGEISSALLPQWLSGHEFLFRSEPDLDRARRLARGIPPAARALTLAYPAGEPLARAIAERIAVNARDAGLAVHVSARHQRPDARLLMLPLASPDPAQALVECAAALGYPDWPRQDTPAALYDSERALLEDGRVVPLFHLPEEYGAAPRVRVWAPPAVGRLGGLRLADVWLEGGGQ